jgi:ubiquinone/menaquinone biosynthesis C-methylase UbiE
MMMPAQTLARQILGEGGPAPMKVLDISAGHGIWGIAFGQQNPQAEVVGLDWPNVLEVARENAAKFGVKDRYTTIAGSAFEVGFGEGYDVVLVPNFLHHFDQAGCAALLKKVHAALKRGGKVVVVEFAPDENRVTPPASATFALVMLAGTPGGDAYTVGELQQMVKVAGFGQVSWMDLPNGMQRVVVGEK